MKQYHRYDHLRISEMMKTFLARLFSQLLSPIDLARRRLDIDRIQLIARLNMKQNTHADELI